MILDPKMAQKTTGFFKGGATFSRLFRDLVQRSTFGRIFVALWLPFGTLLDAFDSFLAPFGSLLDAFGSLLAPFESLWAPFVLPLAPFGQPFGSN